MFEKLDITRMAQAMASYSGKRMGVLAQNVAHADTPGYRAKDLQDFASVYRHDNGAMRATRAGHFSAASAMAEPRLLPTQGNQAPNGNTVSLEREMVRLAEVRQNHEMALGIYRATSNVLRASLGRK